MSEDEFWIFGVLALLHAWRSVRIVAPHVSLLITKNGRHFVLRSAEDGIETGRRRLLILSGFPPLSWSFPTRRWRVAATPKVLFLDDPEQFARLRIPRIPLDDISAVRVEENEVWLDERISITASDEREANSIASFILSLTRSVPEDRERHIAAWLDAACSVENVEERVHNLLHTSRHYRRLTHAHFVFYFLVGPLAIAFYGFSAIWAPLLCVWAGLQILTLIVFWRLSACHSTESLGRRLLQTINLLIVPAEVPWSHDLLPLRTIESTHPLAAACVLLSPDTLHPHAQKALARWSHAPADHEEKWLRDRIRDRLVPLFQQAGLSLESLEAPPTPDGKDVVAYCPACRALFRRAGAHCPDCFDIETLAINQRS